MSGDPVARNNPKPDRGSGPLSRPAAVLTIALAASGLFLAALDFSINVSLPTIRDSLGASLVSVQGIIIFYHASRSGLAPTAGGVGDAFGLRRVFLAGVAAYTLAVALISLQDVLGAVIGLRVLQGLGAGTLFTISPALVARAFGPSRRGAALGVTIAAVSAGQLTATLGGGWLSQNIGWEAIFYSRVPIGLLLLGAGAIALREPPRPDVRPLPERLRDRFDWTGAGLLYSWLFLLVMAVSFARLDGLASPAVAGFTAAGLVTFLLHRYQQARAERPVIPRGLWNAPGFRAGAASNVLLTMGSFLTWFLFPFYISDVLGRGPIALGAILAATAGAATLGSTVGGWVADRMGDRLVTFAGAAVTALGLVWIAGLGAEASLADVAARVVLAGAGFGVHQAAVYSLTLRHTRPEHAGAGSAVLAVAQTVGTPLSIAFGTAVFAWRESVSLGRGEGATEAFVSAFGDAYLAAAAIALLAGFVVLSFTRVVSGAPPRTQGKA